MAKSYFQILFQEKSFVLENFSIFKTDSTNFHSFSILQYFSSVYFSIPSKFCVIVFGSHAVLVLPIYGLLYRCLNDWCAVVLANWPSHCEIKSVTENVWCSTKNIKEFPELKSNWLVQRYCFIEQLRYFVVSWAIAFLGWPQ